jgi:hypothetical protein
MRTAGEGGVEDDAVTLLKLRLGRGEKAVVSFLCHGR